jgi:hypothetical protein
MPQPEQVPLDRVGARLKPVIAGRRAAALAARPNEQSVDDQAAGLSGQRRARRPIPTTRRRSSPNSGCAIQPHRQRPKTPRQRAARSTRADARGTAGTDPSRRCQYALSAGRNATPKGPGDPSAARLRFGVRSYVGAHPDRVALSGRKAADEDRAATRSFSFREPSRRRTAAANRRDRWPVEDDRGRDERAARTRAAPAETRCRQPPADAARQRPRARCRRTRCPLDRRTLSP